MNQQTLCPRYVLATVICAGIFNAAAAADLRVYDQGQLPDDARLQDLKDLNGYFPFEVPAGEALWEARAAELRQRVRIATGLWPMPERTPLNPVIFGKVERDGFTVEKVYFESLPGFYVTGLLFRPELVEGPVPGVLCPHGHGGRLQDYGEQAMAGLIESGAERFEKSGRFPKLARCAQLARMGCVAFIFDMLGYADSVQLSRELVHGFARQRPEFEGSESWGLFSTQAEMRMQSVMGLQTWNGIRALDFLEQLPDVDPERLAVTGGSGGGTQTILLGAIDPRPVVAFPQGMVSTAMQGGCTCENCCLLRVGTGNVELAALFAPKPLAMTAANDWTKEMMTKGYPQLQQLYAMLGVPENVLCEAYLHFPHNYNAVTREVMYSWFNRHLGLGLEEPIVEQDYEPLTPEEYTVWDDEHPRPTGGTDFERELTTYLAEQSDRQLAALTPTDTQSLREFRDVVGAAFRTIIGRGLPDPDDIQRTKVDKEEGNGYLYFEDILRLQSRGEEFPVVSLFPTGTEWNGQVVIRVDGAGKRGMFDAAGQPRIEVLRLLDGGMAVLAADLFQQGEFLLSQLELTEQRVVENPREFAGYTFAYNDTLFARRVHDILTLISWVRNDEHAPRQVHLLGVNGGGPLAAAARAIAGGQIDRAAVDTEGFRFRDLTSYRDPNFVPGSVKYGDLPALLALSAPNALWIGGERGEVPELVRSAYVAAGHPDAVTSSPLQTTNEAAVEWLLAR
jgi:cephalosporin-C deacetylase-like acetyl esterase